MRNTRCFDVKVGRATWDSWDNDGPRALVVVADSFEEASAAAIMKLNALRDLAKEQGHLNGLSDKGPWTSEDVLEMTVVRGGAIVSSATDEAM